VDKMAVIGKRLKHARERKKLSQIEAAKLLGISNGTLSGYERNYRDPDTNILEKMADLYEVTTDYLLGRTDDPTPSNVDKIKKLGLKEDEEIHFFDLEGMSDEDIEFIKNQIEFLRKKAKQHRKDTE
jgi:transcriptional regulator with XRE-family HTH domain